MEQLQLFKPESYTDAIIYCRKQLLELPKDEISRLKTAKYLVDYTYNAVYESPSFSAYHRKVVAALNEVAIVCYHNTRLDDESLVFENGLRFSDWNYVQRIFDAANRIVGEDLAAQIKFNLEHNLEYYNNESSNSRSHQVSFYFDADYSEDYKKYCVIYGGELMEDICVGEWAQNNIQILKPLFTNGHPCVVAFYIPFKQMSNHNKEEIARFLIMEWVHVDLRHDETEHDFDLQEGIEIPKESIISITELNTDFSELNNYYFGDKII